MQRKEITAARNFRREFTATLIALAILAAAKVGLVGQLPI